MVLFYNLNMEKFELEKYVDEAIKQVNYLCDGILQSIKKSLIDSPIIMEVVQNMQNKINNVKGGLCGTN